MHPILTPPPPLQCNQQKTYQFIPLYPNSISHMPKKQLLSLTHENEFVMIKCFAITSRALCEDNLYCNMKTLEPRYEALIVTWLLNAYYSTNSNVWIHNSSHCWWPFLRYLHVPVHISRSISVSLIFICEHKFQIVLIVDAWMYPILSLSLSQKFLKVWFLMITFSLCIWNSVKIRNALYSIMLWKSIIIMIKKKFLHVSLLIIIP